MKTKFEFHIKLTPEQIAKLQPAMDAAKSEAEMSRFGSIVCQLYRLNDNDFNTEVTKFILPAISSRRNMPQFSNASS